MSKKKKKKDEVDYLEGLDFIGAINGNITGPEAFVPEWAKAISDSSIQNEDSVPKDQHSGIEAAKKALATEAQKAAEAAFKKKPVEVENPPVSAPKIASGRNKRLSTGHHQSPRVTTSHHESPRVTSKRKDQQSYGSPPVTTGHQLRVTTGHHLEVISRNRTKWRDSFCLLIKYLNDTQPNNIPQPTNGWLITAATGLAPGSVKNALSAAQKLGFIDGPKGQGGRFKPFVLKCITPMG